MDNCAGLKNICEAGGSTIYQLEYRIQFIFERKLLNIAPLPGNMSNQNKLHLTITVKKLLIAIAAVAAIVGFFLLPPNKVWVQKRIFSYWREFNKQKQNLSLEYRKAHRFGASYTFSKQIADSFRSKKDVLVLVPPSAYFKNHQLNYEVPEPSVFYYFTGLKTVTVNSNNKLDAGWYVHVQNRLLFVDSITDKKTLEDTIASWKKLVKK